jgi:pyruvate dehydrogenase E1 component
MKALPDMVARWLPPHFLPLGTDGFGRSDTRENLRAMFEIDPPSIAAATLAELARCGAITGATAAKAIRDLGLDPEKVDALAL